MTYEFGIPFNFAAPYLDGVYLAVNALPDAYLIYDAHDCGYYKAEKIAGIHDLFSDLMRWDGSNRIIRTNLDQPDYIMGSDAKLSKKLLQVGERDRPGLVIVARSNVVVAAGSDAKPVIRDLHKKLEAPVLLLSDRNLDKDFLTGYLDALELLLGKLPSGEPSPDRVSLVGYLYDRNEGDHRGNVSELRRLLKAIGIRKCQILLDGTPFGKLKSQPPPSLVVDLTPGLKGVKNYARRCKARYLRAPLPMGLNGTREWLLKIAEFTDSTMGGRVFVEREIDNLARQLKWLLPRFFFGRYVLVFADSQLLPPLTGFLRELGLTITAVGCTSAGNSALPDYPQVPPEMNALREFIDQARADGRADLVIGNAITGQLARELEIPFVELGYPSNFHHHLHPAPWLGFAGVRVLVEKMINAFLSSPGGPACG